MNRYKCPACGGKPSDTIKDFFLNLSRMSGTGNRIEAKVLMKS